MANRNNNDFFALLRSQGLRKRVARPIAELGADTRRGGAKGERMAQQAIKDLNAAVADIRKRVLRADDNRSQAARKAARNRRRNATKRAASAKKGAQTRARAGRTATKGKA